MSNIHDKYKFFKTAVMLLVLVMTVGVVDAILFASQRVFSNVGRNVAPFLFVVFFLILLFAFGWFVWYSYNQDWFDQATTLVNQHIQNLMGTSPPASSESTTPSTKESAYWLFLKYLGFFAGLLGTTLFAGAFVNALGNVPPSYNIFAVLIISVLSTILAFFSFYFLMTGTLFDLNRSNLNKHFYNMALIFYPFFVTLLLYYNPFEKVRQNIGLVILGSTLFLAFIFPIIYASYYETQGFTKESVIKVMENSFKILLGLGLSGMVIYIFYILFGMMTTLLSPVIVNIPSSILNLVFVVCLLALLYKFLDNNKYVQTLPPAPRLIIYSFLYIPCLFSIVIDVAMAGLTPGKDRTYLILILVMSLILIYVFSRPLLQRWWILYDGKLVYNCPPLALNKQTKLATYQELNDPPKTKKQKKMDMDMEMSKSWEEAPRTDTVPVSQHEIQTEYYKDDPKQKQGFQASLERFFTGSSDKDDIPVTMTMTSSPTVMPEENEHPYAYQYALSSWIFLDANPPNTNLAYNQFVSLLNYANKPNILYRATTNTLRVVVQYNHMDSTNEFAAKPFPLDEHNNRIVFEKKNVLLQKWNHVLLNNVGGTLDIFINGELVGTANHVVPYLNYDNLMAGTNKGVDGKICNVVYYQRSLSKDQIQLIYNYSKNSDPPTFPSVF